MLKSLSMQSNHPETMSPLFKVWRLGEVFDKIFVLLGNLIFGHVAEGTMHLCTKLRMVSDSAL